jgi:hypothetical protein
LKESFVELTIEDSRRSELIGSAAPCESAAAHVVLMMSASMPTGALSPSVDNPADVSAELPESRTFTGCGPECRRTVGKLSNPSMGYLGLSLANLHLHWHVEADPQLLINTSILVST